MLIPIILFCFPGNVEAQVVKRFSIAGAAMAPVCSVKPQSVAGAKADLKFSRGVLPRVSGGFLVSAIL